jgi:CheY-like chemotaxis protein
MEMNQLNILLADDDTDDCVFFKDAITELSNTTQLTAVHDGDQLMNYLTDNLENLPHVLFLDLNMPRKNGLECLSEIKRNKKLNKLPVIIFSTSYSTDTISLLFKIGAHVYIHKPNDFAKLKQVIQHGLTMAGERIFAKSQIKYILNA